MNRKYLGQLSTLHVYYEILIKINIRHDLKDFTVFDKLVIGSWISRSSVFGTILLSKNFGIQKRKAAIATLLM